MKISTLDLIDWDDLPDDCIADCYHQGDCEDDCIYWVSKLNVTMPEFAALYRQDMIDEISETGAWTDEDLATRDDDDLKKIVLWLKAAEVYDRKYDDEDEENNDVDGVLLNQREPNYKQQFFYNMFFYDNTHEMAYDELYQVHGDDRDWNVRHLYATLRANFDLTFVGMTGGFPEDL